MESFKMLLRVLVSLLCLHSISGQEYYLTLKGNIIRNHTLVSMEQIGEGLEALHCVTPHRPCCRDTPQGEWYYPDGTAIPGRIYYHNLYRNRNNDGGVLLNRHNNRLGPHGKYKCVIPKTGSTESIALIVGIYSIFAYPTIYYHPVSLLNVVPGSRVSFSVRSSDALKYRWVYDEDVYLEESDKYHGVNRNTLEIVNVGESDEGDYHCVVEKELSVSSKVATLSVLDLPVITEQPVSLHNLLTGQNATFTLTASGMDLSYLWQYADGSPLQQSIEGVTTPTLTIRGVTGEDIKSYQCAVSNNAGTILSVQVNLTLLQCPLIEVQPEHMLDTQPGQDISLTLLASGGDLTYQWQYGDGSPLGDDHEGVTTPTLTIRAVEEAGSYRCAVSNPVGTVFSTTVNVTVMMIPVQPVTSLNATPSVTSVHLSWTPSPQQYRLSFQIIYHHLVFPDLSTVVEVEEPRYTAVALLPRGRYQFSVRQMRGSVMSGAVSVDVKLTENIPSVQAITVEVINSSSIAVSWDPLSPLPGWNISYYQVDVTSFTTGTPSQHIHAHTERTTNGNETSAVVVSSDLLMVGGVDLVTEVRGVLDVGVDGVGLMEGEIAVMRTLLEPEKTPFQLVLGPIDYCISWTDEKTFEVRSDIQTELMKVVSEYCQCNFSINSISPGVFSCRQSSNSVTYRSSIIGIDSDQIVSMIEQWVKTGTAAMLIRSFFVDVRNYEECPVQLKSIMDPECLVNEQGLAPRTLISSDPDVINCVNSCISDSSTVSLCEPNP